MNGVLCISSSCCFTNFTTLQVACYVIIAEYDNFNPTATYKNLSASWRCAHPTCASAPRIILIFMKVNWKEWSPIDGSTADYRALPAFTTGIQYVVSETLLMVDSLLHQQDAAYHRRAGSAMRSSGSYSRCGGYRRPQWYVQPIDGTAAENHLTSGLFAGINWLLRCIASNSN